MDFGEILNQFEKSQSQKAKSELHKKQSQQKSHKKANAPTAEEKALAAQKKSLEQIIDEENQRHINPMTLWLNRYGVVDKDKIADEAGESEKMHNINYLRTMKWEASIDLHQLTGEEAWAKLDSFVGDCKRRGLKKILIIHGKGIHSNGSDPVLGSMVRKFIEQDKRLGTSGHPDRNNGGNGATWVVIK